MTQPQLQPTELEVHSAIAVILSDKPAYPKSLNYAVGYAQYALTLSGEALRVQCLYILSNIQRWRHPSAKSVRSTLKAFAKGA